MDDKIKRTVRRIVAMLVQGDYDGIERLTNGQRLRANELVDGVMRYGRTLVMPPEEAFEDIDSIEIEGAKPKQWDVRLSLWTIEEGRSDLTLELTITESDGELYIAQVDNLHVL